MSNDQFFTKKNKQFLQKSKTFDDRLQTFHFYKFIKDLLKLTTIRRHLFNIYTTMILVSFKIFNEIQLLRNILISKFFLQNLHYFSSRKSCIDDWTNVLIIDEIAIFKKSAFLFFVFQFIIVAKILVFIQKFRNLIIIEEESVRSSWRQKWNHSTKVSRLICRWRHFFIRRLLFFFKQFLLLFILLFFRLFFIIDFSRSLLDKSIDCFFSFDDFCSSIDSLKFENEFFRVFFIIFSNNKTKLVTIFFNRRTFDSSFIFFFFE